MIRSSLRQAQGERSMRLRLWYLEKCSNVRWVVCWFEESRQVFDSFPGYFRPIGIIDKFTLYEVLREPSFFLKGSGTVQADYNRIELSNVRTMK
jgi:hypothetical protein